MPAPPRPAWLRGPCGGAPRTRLGCWGARAGRGPPRAPGGTSYRHPGRNRERGRILKEGNVFLRKVYLWIYVRGRVFAKPQPEVRSQMSSDTLAPLKSCLCVWLGRPAVQTHNPAPRRASLSAVSDTRHAAGDWAENAVSVEPSWGRAGALPCPPRFQPAPCPVSTTSFQPRPRREGPRRAACAGLRLGGTGPGRRGPSLCSKMLARNLHSGLCAEAWLSPAASPSRSGWSLGPARPRPPRAPPWSLFLPPGPAVVGRALRP